MSNDDTDTKRNEVSRRTALKVVGAGTLSAGLFSTRAAAGNGDCALDPCTQAFLNSDPVLLPSSQWDGTIKKNRPLVHVGTGVEVPTPDGPIVAPFGFDPMVICVQEGTTVKWKWKNQKTVTTDIPETVHHNIDLFQFPDDGGTCSVSDIEDLAGEVEPNTFVTSGHPVGFNPPDEPEPVSFEHTFDEPGVYPYYCEPHGPPMTFSDPDGSTSENEALDDYHPPPESPPGLDLSDPQNILGMRGAVIVREKKGPR